ncbi:DeoR/GlpR family DNA-binding transcription regulator [Virgibacillus halodenitrificans]|uniref:DeoR/GlpR family DNA-binding transcription regulator n=1 Tax=Virgibacillus halodenitrificans TaxID=1482 RepID=UPI000EF51759|nr:DeoR/GlpR family DNA-binding transcription regulator [Virgibacillus halodenitrificans]MCJ0929661.1 DeoR/GlpR family DNA-binding transcription regulator [Virgibacillus halodenitrificans]WHX26112.1 DeoR/GlpR family DNA-binding transcription regulator [Virgibacillus halodenitrificans]
MLVAERHKKILNTVVEEGSVRVSQLSKMFGFTEETIRRDLEKLEREGKLKRTHGGAISIQEGEKDLPYAKRETQRVSEKEEIAQLALSFIEEDDCILLDGSSTANFLAKALPNIPLTVITNSVRALMELMPKEKIHVICTGGSFSHTAHSFLGPLTIQSLDNYHADKAFISCKALDVKWGISEANDMQAMVKKKMLEIAQTNFLLLDHSKVGKKAITNVAGLEKIDYIISDALADTELINEIKSKDVQVISPDK